MRKTWFWNVDPTWENFSYLLEDQHRAKKVENAFLENKYKKSCLYFAGVSIESLLNKIMRTKLEDEGKSENKIYNTLRYEGFKGKLKKWPKKVFDSSLTLTDKESNLFDLFETFYEMRNTLTHPKHEDHSIYVDLEMTDVSEIKETVSKILLQLFILRDKIFPYWLLGWNFIGFNRDDNHPVILNNSQFLHALSRMGIINSQTAWSADHSDEWQIKNMSSYKSFLSLKKKLNSYPLNEENSENYEGPILTKNWWEY
ncbi:hypothetical protein CK503_15685 [Aliifodinibius salipaludis]|uniref:Uncharacterized protein n=1 Tax=Fodinibius salipaludis TaxID=2032627 RepID=A0A2A2G715_9BACT|nr:hypothetical protein [Aliifodinibius salipaludis]PAU92649.1 hypothetical protein CK503_15685 [Aliifodinibius salipaludis]